MFVLTEEYNNNNNNRGEGETHDLWNAKSRSHIRCTVVTVRYVMMETGGVLIKEVGRSWTTRALSCTWVKETTFLIGGGENVLFLNFILKVGQSIRSMVRLNCIS